MFSKSVNVQLVVILVVLFGILAAIGDGSPPDIQERNSYATE